MPFLCGTFAGVRGRLSGIGTGAGNVERSRRHTISTVVTSASSPSSPIQEGLGPAWAPRAEDSCTDGAGRTIVQVLEAVPTKRKRHKSVTFSSVDIITELPAVTNSSVSIPPPSAASSHSPEISVQSQNSTSTSALAGRLSDRHATDGHHAPDHPSEWPRRRRYTVQGLSLPPGFPSPRPHGKDSERSSYSPIDWEENHECRIRLRKRRHTTLASPSDYHHNEQSLDNEHRQSPSGYVALRYQNSPSPEGSWYDHSWTSCVGGKQQPALPLHTLGGRCSLDTPRSIDGGYPSEGSRLAQYSIYRIDPPPIFSFPRAYFSGPAGQCDSVEYTILEFAPRFSSAHAQYPYRRPECLALLDTRTASLVSSHFPPPKRFVEGKGIFLVSHAPNKKGLGMFAQTPLRTGEVILTEVPTLIVPSELPNFRQNSGSVLDVQEDKYDKMFELLSRAVKKELMDLAWGGAYSNHGGDVNVYETIMRINPLAVSLPLSSAPSSFSSIHRGIFLKTGRCNHSCGPNAQWTFDPSSLTLFLTCLRPIKMGDEITIAYVSPYLPFLHRRADLKNLFGFDCTCDCCSRILSQFQNHVQSLLIEESDSARKFLTTFWDSYPSFEAWTKNPSTYPDDLLISAHKSALEMIEREGLEVLSSIQHSQSEWYTSGPNPRASPVLVPDIILHTDRIALCYGVLSDIGNFQKWVARALDARLSHSGPGSAVADGWDAFEDIKWIGGNGKSCQRNEDEVRLGGASCRAGAIFEKWIANPETFPAWGFRR